MGWGQQTRLEHGGDEMTSKLYNVQHLVRFADVGLELSLVSPVHVMGSRRANGHHHPRGRSHVVKQMSVQVRAVNNSGTQLPKSSLEQMLCYEGNWLSVVIAHYMFVSSVSSLRGYILDVGRSLIVFRDRLKSKF